MESKYLKFIQFKDIEVWDVKRQSFQHNKFNFPTVKLSKILAKTQVEWVEIEEEKKYPILGVRANGKGVYINRIAVGSELTMKRYQKSKQGLLFYCKVRTVNGQWGIVYPEYENTYASSNMQYLEVNYDKINPKFLELLLSVKKITDEWDKNAIGADGRHFTLSTLLNLEIPLPTIQEQQAIVDVYFSKINEANQLEVEANNIDQEIEQYLFTELEISIGKKNEKKEGLNLVEFSQLERWDTLFLLNNLNETKGKYNNVKFSNVITSFNKNGNKSIRVDSNIKFPLDKFHYIGMENIERETGNLLDFQKVLGKEIKSQTLRVPKGYFIYGKLRPYLNKYWINHTDLENIICSSEFFVFDISENINKIFFREVLASQFIQEQISDKTSGARMPRINEDIFYNLYFPLPPIDKQIKIATESSKLRNSKTEKLALSKLLKHQANQEFEKVIF